HFAKGETAWLLRRQAALAKGKLEGVRFLSNKISKLENAMKSSSQLRKLPLEGKLSALPTDEV
ncbi:MAG: hypothetical protein PUD16_08100, partial [bacterium]|nr:hypothetical protein [bacterium]